MNIEEQLQKANSNMQKCESCYKDYQDSHDLMMRLFDGVKIKGFIASYQGLGTELLEDIGSQLGEIYESYIYLGLITWDGKPFDEDSFLRVKAYRKIANSIANAIANGKTISLDDIPEDLKADYPSDQNEFDECIKDYGHMSSDSIRDDISNARQIVDDKIDFLEHPFVNLLYDFDDNIDKLAYNLDGLFVDYIRKVSDFKYFF